MKKLLFAMSLLLTLGLFSACSSNDDENIIDKQNGSQEYLDSTESSKMNNIDEMEFNILNHKFPYKPMNVEDMPDWLAEHISLSIEKSKTIWVYNTYYQLKWKDETYYLVSTAYDITLLDYLYNSQGGRIELSKDDYDNCLAWSSEWCIIYYVQYHLSL